jgi:hypothetical protein
MSVRGISEEEITEVLLGGSSLSATRGRQAREMVFPYRSLWRGRWYAQKKVKVVYVEEEGVAVTVTAYAYYGEWETGV